MTFHTVEMICFHLIVMDMIHVSADLPKFVYKTKKCPIPNNITDWRRSSTRLGCKHDILSKHSLEQKSVYHCLPTNYLNETVEFCGKSVPSDGGYCPVYTYEYGENESPNFVNCSNFLEGCPKEFFFSKQVFKYPACNDINKKDKCYRSDPTCCSDSCGTRQNESNVQVNIAKGDSKETTSETRQNESNVQVNITKGDSEETTSRNMVVLSTGIVFAISLIFLCSFVLPKYLKRNGYTVIQKENGEIPSFYRVKLLEFLFTTGQKLNSESVERLKFVLPGNSNETGYSRRYKMLVKINDGKELLKFMDQLYDFSMNMYILQGFLERINESDLVEECIEFAERTTTCINRYYRRENLEGYRNVSLKLPKEDVHEITAERISALKRNLMNLIDADFDDIVLRGISEGCVIIHTEMRPLLLSKIEKLGIYAEFIFKKYLISKVYSKEHCLYPSQKSGQLCYEKNYQDKDCSTTAREQNVIAQVTELPDLPDSLNYINIAIMGAPLRGNFTFVKMCTEALKSQTVILTRAALMTTSSNSTTPLTVISSKTRSGRPIQIRILESENIQTMDSVVDSSTCATEASTGRRNLSELDRKLHCVVYVLDASEETLYGYNEIDNEKIKNSVHNQEKPKLLLLWTKNFSEVKFQDIFRFRVQACDDFGLPLRLIMPACDPLSSETHTNEALKSLLDMINRAREYATENSQ